MPQCVSCQMCAAPRTQAPVAPEIDWERLLDQIPLDLEQTARSDRALVRRRRIRHAAALLRSVLLYAFSDWSLDLVAARLAALEVADLSAPALFIRFQHARCWLGRILASLLGQPSSPAQAPVQIRLLDASVISKPGSSGTDWRVHLECDLAQAAITAVELTDAQGGETLARHSHPPDLITLADRGYCQRKGLGVLLAHGGQIIVRVNTHNLPLTRPDGTPLDLLAWLPTVPADQPAETPVQVHTPDGVFALRLIACRLPQEAADANRRRLWEQARKKGRTPITLSLEAAGFLIVVSSLPTDVWSAPTILRLYRFRWQVELVFKRLKGILTLGNLPAQDPDLAQTYLLGKLIGALLVQGVAAQVLPKVRDWFDDTERPVSLWRWLAHWTDAVRTAVTGVLSLTQHQQAIVRLGRHFRDEPRRRIQQAAAARHFLKTHFPCPSPLASS